ncbi:hypothetical protein [Psychrobacter sp.]|uniref:hypothetical protein n=1 Tax=Psychrobacter sp. TaxID=56811 RepID=UPI00264894CC|nr:hypothetical protein [Psychrobacter sp.]MDN6307078.1 hypothetical protein [Psychrobacter sp.]
MGIIDQLEQTVTPAVLEGQALDDNVAYISLLEQFYAILSARLAMPQIYSQLLRRNDTLPVDGVAAASLFEQIWPDTKAQQTIVQELAATHHIEQSETTQLLIKAAPLAYRELKALADGQFLPAFLQDEQSAVRQYLPIWSAPIITAAQSIDGGADMDAAVEKNTAAVGETPSDSLHEEPITEARRNNTTADIAKTQSRSIRQADAESSNADFFEEDVHDDDHKSAIHANPAAHRLPEDSGVNQKKGPTRNQGNRLLVRMFLLLLVIAVIGLIAWAFLVKPDNAEEIEPVEETVTAEPAVEIPTTEEPKEIATPVELMVSVDDSGSLYSCSATVGDAALQSTIQQAFNSSFGGQSSRCEVTVQSGVSNTMADLPAPSLPNILTILRSIPFARLHLQNNSLRLEAPDDMQQQRLIADIRALAPATTIATTTDSAAGSTAPITTPEDNNDSDVSSEMSGMNHMSGINDPNNQMDTGDVPVNNQNGYNDRIAESGEYQATEDNTGDMVIPAPNNNSNNRLGNNMNNVPADRFDNSLTNNGAANSRQTSPSGPISEAEADEMASSVFVAEPAQVR